MRDNHCRKIALVAGMLTLLGCAAQVAVGNAVKQHIDCGDGKDVWKASGSAKEVGVVITGSKGCKAVVQGAEEKSTEGDAKTVLVSDVSSVHVSCRGKAAGLDVMRR